MDKQIKKMWYVYTDTHTYIHTQTHTLKYYSAIIKNKILSFAATQMELEVMLNEISQEQEDKHPMFSLVETKQS